MKRWLPRTEEGWADLWTWIGVLVLAVAAFVYSHWLYARDLVRVRAAVRFEVHQDDEVPHGTAARPGVDECTHFKGED